MLLCSVRTDSVEVVAVTRLQELTIVSPRIAFLDVDGTLIDSRERIAASTIEAIQRARANGHLVFVCTGRASVEIYPAILDIGFDGVISAAGGFATVGDELVISRTMPPRAVTRMIDFYEKSGYDFYLQSYNEIFPSPGVLNRFIDYFVQDHADDHAPRPETASVVNAADHPALKAYGKVRPYNVNGIAKSVFLASDMTAFDRVEAELSDEFHVITGTIPHLGRGSGEVTLAGVNKGTTILQLVDRLGIDPSTTIGIGDSSNDIEMLELCGVGIAMGNATDEVKSHADEVTTSVLDDGVWNAFDRHGLL